MKYVKQYVYIQFLSPLFFLYCFFRFLISINKSNFLNQFYWFFILIEVGMPASVSICKRCTTRKVNKVTIQCTCASYIVAFRGMQFLLNQFPTLNCDAAITQYTHIRRLSFTSIFPLITSRTIIEGLAVQANRPFGLKNKFDINYVCEV